MPAWPGRGAGRSGGGGRGGGVGGRGGRGGGWRWGRAPPGGGKTAVVERGHVRGQQPQQHGGGGQDRDGGDVDPGAAGQPPCGGSERDDPGDGGGQRDVSGAEGGDGGGGCGNRERHDCSLLHG